MTVRAASAIWSRATGRQHGAPAPGGPRRGRARRRAAPSGGAERCRLDKGLKGKSKATVDNYRSLAGKNLIPQIGAIKLKELTADRLDVWIDERAGELATRSLRLIHQILERSIRHAQARDKVRRNVASLITIPEGRPGRPSQAMTLDQAVSLLGALGSGADFRLWAYVILSLLTGVRTEEARALHWAEVDLEAGTVAVYRSVRAKGDTKTRRSRRVLQMPKKVAAALKEHRKRQAAERLRAGEAWQDHDLVSAAWTERRSTGGRSAASSRRSRRRPDWARTGFRASCVTLSCPS